jgi:hypothetical protein
MLSLISEQVRFVKLKECLLRRGPDTDQYIEIIHKKNIENPAAKKNAEIVGCEIARAKPTRQPASHASVISTVAWQEKLY